ncbi:PLP-dependent aminotransferase family protein [Streptomyces sp. NPDC127033]|uniref:aminotransferase-like domain-containing protein n=1 Tax=Streptomyces sp. NPDC127033 TaxID=3347110 RepID=UPI00364CD769
MNGLPPLSSHATGRISAARLASLLGQWHRGGPRSGGHDLADALATRVRDGRLPPGTRLPSERELAGALGVSRTMIGAALERLRDAGLVASRQGSGSWTAAPPGVRHPGTGLPDGAELIDLTRASPGAADGLLPAFEAAQRALREALHDETYDDLGIMPLRERLAARYTARGLPTAPSEIMITNGAHHGFALALRLLAGPGDRVLVEQPGYPHAFDAVTAARGHLVPVPVDPFAASGWDIDGIAATLRQTSPRLAYLMVDFHNPTGRRMAAEDRERLGAVLAATRTHTVVDESAVELDLGGADGGNGAPDRIGYGDGGGSGDGCRTGGAPPPLAAFAPRWTITVGSPAKTHWGGLRIGWIRASEELIGRLGAIRASLDLGSPLFEQLWLAGLLTDPVPCPGPRRRALRAQRDALAGAVRAECPDWSFRTPEGGVNLWCRLPEPIGSRLAGAARQHGVLLTPGARFGVQDGLERWLRLPFAQPPDRLREAVRRIAAARAGLTGAP